MARSIIVDPGFIEGGNETGVDLTDLTDFLEAHGITSFTGPELARRDIPPLHLWARIIPTVLLLQRTRVLMREKYPMAYISVSSAYRSPEHNEDIGGSEDSQHMYFCAIDFSPMRAQTAPMNHAEFIRLARKDPLFPFVFWKDYGTFIHMDTRGIFSLDPRGKNFK